MMDYQPCTTWEGSDNYPQIANADSQESRAAVATLLQNGWANANYHCGLSNCLGMSVIDDIKNLGDDKAAVPLTQCPSVWMTSSPPPEGETTVCWTFACEFIYTLGAGRRHSRQTQKQPPSSWKCDASSYGSGDGCHCNCGAWDPDCEPLNATAVDCPNQVIFEPFLTK